MKKSREERSGSYSVEFLPFAARSGRVAQAFNFADIADTVGAPSLRCSQGRVLRTPAPRSYAARSRNEIFVHPSFTRTGPASSRR